MPRISIHPLTFSTFCSMKLPKQPGLCYQNKFFNVLQNHTVWLFKKKIKKLSNNRKHRTAREGQLDKITLFKKNFFFKWSIKKINKTQQINWSDQQSSSTKSYVLGKKGLSRNTMRCRHRASRWVTACRALSVCVRICLFKTDAIPS